MAENTPSKGLSILGITLALGLIAAAFVLGMQFKNFRQPGTITVKGLSEKGYQANNAAWQTSVAVHGDTYKEALDGLEKTRPALIKFLQKQGFSSQEIQILNPVVDPHYVQVHSENGSSRQVQDGFDGEQKIMVKTQNLVTVQKANQAILSLRAVNETIRFEQPEYLIGNLEEIKHALINQATEDAYKRAQEFSKNSGGKVGVMRSASQGSFNIYADSGSAESADYGGVYDKSTVGKLVRLVVTIEYGID